MKYDGGIIVAADKLGSYGSLARFRNVERIFKATDEAVLACGGDVADYQFIREVVEQKVWVMGWGDAWWCGWWGDVMCSVV